MKINHRLVVFAPFCFPFEKSLEEITSHSAVVRLNMSSAAKKRGVQREGKDTRGEERRGDSRKPIRLAASLPFSLSGVGNLPKKKQQSINTDFFDS